MTIHMKNHHVPQNLKCDKFDFFTSEPKALEEHLIQDHTDVNSSDATKSYQCGEGECRFVAENPRELIAHFLNIHNFPSISLKCDLCDFVGHDENLWNVHMVNNHEDILNYTPIELIKVFYNAIGSMLWK